MMITCNKVSRSPGVDREHNAVLTFREGVTSAAAARGKSMLEAAAAARPAVSWAATGLLSFWARAREKWVATAVANGSHVADVCQ